MTKWGMVIDIDKCNACQACVIACKVENNIPFMRPEEAEKGRSIKWMDLLSFTEGEYPEVKMRILPRPCMMCENPPCIKVCPVGATYINEEGLVGQVYSRCIGCRYCMAACPYTLRYFNWYGPVWPDVMKQGLSPDVSIRPKGVMEKCSFCSHRLVKARDRARFENRSIAEGEYVPSCVEACPTGAMYFGDLEDAESQVARLARSPRAFRLLEDLGTEPKVIYLREGA